MVRDGKLNPEQAKVFVDDMMQQLKSDQGNFEVQMQRQLAEYDAGARCTPPGRDGRIAGPD